MRRGCILQQPLPSASPGCRAGQEAEGRMGMQGLVTNLRATLSSLSVDQLHVSPCKLSLANFDSEVAAHIGVTGLLPI